MSAARVYLFADVPSVTIAGAWSVRFVAGAYRSGSPAALAFTADCEKLRDPDQPRGRHLRAARAWWLVECESAEAGRRVILHPNPNCEGMLRCDDCRSGRILASGGAA